MDLFLLPYWKHLFASCFQEGVTNYFERVENPPIRRVIGGRGPVKSHAWQGPLCLGGQGVVRSERNAAVGQRQSWCFWQVVAERACATVAVGGEGS